MVLSGCKGGTGSEESSSEEATEAAVEEEHASSVEITEDIWVEVMVEVFNASTEAMKKYKDASDVEKGLKAVEATEKVFKKYGVTADELEEFLDGLPEEKAEELQQRYANKAMGLEEEK